MNHSRFVPKSNTQENLKLSFQNQQTSLCLAFKGLSSNPPNSKRGQSLTIRNTRRTYKTSYDPEEKNNYKD